MGFPDDNKRRIVIEAALWLLLFAVVGYSATRFWSDSPYVSLDYRLSAGHSQRAGAVGVTVIVDSPAELREVATSQSLIDAFSWTESTPEDRDAHGITGTLAPTTPKRKPADELSLRYQRSAKGENMVVLSMTDLPKPVSKELGRARIDTSAFEGRFFSNLPVPSENGYRLVNGRRLADYHIVLADLETYRLSNNDRITLNVPATWTEDAKRYTLTTTSALYAQLASTFGRPIEGPFSVILVDLGTDVDLVPSSSEHGTVLQWDGGGVSKWDDLGRLMAYYWTKHEHTSNDIPAIDDRWLAEGLAHWATAKALGRLTLLDYDDYISGIYNQSYHSLILGFQLNLTEVARGNTSTSRDTFATVSTLTLHYIDEILSHVAGADYLQHWVSASYKDRETAVTLANLLAPASPADRARIEAVFENRGMENDANRTVRVNDEIESPDDLAEPGAHPRVTLVITANNKGYIEHCGCKVNQSGGLAKRGAAIERLREEGTDVFLVDLGDNLPGDDEKRALSTYDNVEFSIYLDVLKRMGYDKLAIGQTELFTGRQSLLAMAAKKGFVAASANFTPDPRVIRVVRYWERQTTTGARVVFIPVTAPELWLSRRRVIELGAETFENRPAVDGVHDALLRAKLGPEDHAIVYGRMDWRTAARILAEFEEVDLAITHDRISLIRRDDVDATPAAPNLIEQLPNGKYVVLGDTNNYGFTRLELAVVAGSLVPVDAERVFLDDTREEHPEIREFIDHLYAEAYEDAALVAQARSTLHEAELESAEYVGVAACQGCHVDQYQQWLTTPHATAITTLVKEHRQNVPGCVTCHVIGYGITPGYTGNLERDAYANVQCEACHGPGSRHVTAPADYEMVYIGNINWRVCTSCHTTDHSDLNMAVNYAQYMAKVRH